MLHRFLATLLLLCASLAWAQPPVPLLWKVSDADNSVYLLGSVHLLTPADYPLAPAVDAAFADSARVVLELDAAALDPQRLGSAMMARAQRSDGRSLQQSLPPATWQRLQAYAQSRGLAPEALQGYKAWFVALLVLMGESSAAGLDPALGLDQHFVARAARAGKPVVGLETVQAQLDLFDHLDPAGQVQMLQETLDELGDMRTHLDALLDAWRRGDAAALERQGLQDLRRNYPQLYQGLTVARNRAWLAPVEALLTGSAHTNALVVVGALHLVGEDGLVRLLQQRGYRVQRLR